MSNKGQPRISKIHKELRQRVFEIAKAYIVLNNSLVREYSTCLKRIDVGIDSISIVQSFRDYLLDYGLDGIKAFEKLLADKSIDDEDKVTTIKHDLSGIGDEFFSPRSIDNYIEHVHVHDS